MNVKDYEAATLMGKLEGKKIPSVMEVTESVLRSNGGSMKREEIIHAVSVATGIKVNTDLSEKVSQSLTQLKNDGKTRNLDHGIWCAV